MKRIENRFVTSFHHRLAASPLNARNTNYTRATIADWERPRDREQRFKRIWRMKRVMRNSQEIVGDADRHFVQDLRIIRMAIQWHNTHFSRFEVCGVWIFILHLTGTNRFLIETRWHSIHLPFTPTTIEIHRKTFNRRRSLRRKEWFNRMHHRTFEAETSLSQIEASKPKSISLIQIHRLIIR